jgi:hypothetical protein
MVWVWGDAGALMVAVLCRAVQDTNNMVWLSRIRKGVPTTLPYRYSVEYPNSNSIEFV